MKTSKPASPEQLDALLKKDFPKQGDPDERFIEQQNNLAHEAIERIKDREVVAFFKFGVQNRTGENEYFALPCELDAYAFLDEDSFQDTHDKLRNGEIDPHNLSMDYWETGILRKFNFGEMDWEPAQDQHNRISERGFTFVTEEKFCELLMNDERLDNNTYANPTQNREANVPDPE